jgi:hypothetical protein
MKKLNPAKFFEYPPTLLDKQDIKELIEVFKTEFENPEVIIENYELENVDEINTFPVAEAHEFKIEGRPPYCYLEGRSYLLRLYLSESENTKLLGVKAKIDKILSKKIGSIGSRRNFLIGIGGLIGIGVGIFGALLIHDVILQLIFAIFGSMIISYLVSGFLLTRFPQIYPHTTIIFQQHEQKPSFWDRNKDKIISSLISGLIVLVVGKLIFNNLAL